MRLIPCELHRGRLADVERQIQATTTAEDLEREALKLRPLKLEIKACKRCKSRPS
jgi:hypothetical protein